MKNFMEYVEEHKFWDNLPFTRNNLLAKSSNTAMAVGDGNGNGYETQR